MVPTIAAGVAFLAGLLPASGQMIESVTRYPTIDGTSFEYEDVDGTMPGTVSVKASALAEFNAAFTEIRANTALQTAISGTAVRDAIHESNPVVITCHDPNGEVCKWTVRRIAVRGSSCPGDTIRTGVETWSDGVPKEGCRPLIALDNHYMRGGSREPEQPARGRTADGRPDPDHHR